MNYVISDIHGHLTEFNNLLSKLNLQPEDTLYILGDVLDRGPHPIKVLQQMMTMPNVIFLIGNHELMALDCMKFLLDEITDETIAALDDTKIGRLVDWLANGGQTTMTEFRALSTEERQDIIDYIRDASIYEPLTIQNQPTGHTQNYLLVHAALGNFAPDKDIEDYSLKELIWDRAAYDKIYYEDTIVVTGHTPTQMIPGNPNPGYIYRKNNHIGMDCGINLPDGRLAAICLETGEEYYT